MVSLGKLSVKFNLQNALRAVQFVYAKTDQNQTAAQKKITDFV